MKSTTIFHLIREIANEAGVSFVLIGGFAVNYYKVTRQTLDIDFLITKEDFDKISGPLEKSGFKLEDIKDVFARFSGNKYYLMDIDFMFVDAETLKKIVNDGKEISIAKQKFLVPSLENLIALKLHSVKYNQKSREYKDLPDIINLIKMNNVNCKTKKFHELCLKYGTEELYKKIVKGVK